MSKISFTMLFLPLLLSSCATEPGEQDRSGALDEQIETILASHPDAIVAVSVLDPATETTFHLRGDRLFHAASTMKIPVLIELFRQVKSGRFALDDSLQLRNRFRSIVDGSEFEIEDDSDDAIYSELGHMMSIRDLARHMITVSSNLATNLLIEFVTADSVQRTSKRLGTTRMITLRGVEDLKAYEQGLSNRATSMDLAVLLEAIRTGRAVSPGYDRQMLEILFDQKFNDMIPAGLPDGVRVAHKTGQITEINHDAAIVYPTTGESYVLVILTEGIPNSEVSAALGADIARIVHEVLRPDPNQ